VIGPDGVAVTTGAVDTPAARQRHEAARRVRGPVAVEEGSLARCGAHRRRRHLAASARRVGQHRRADARRPPARRIYSNAGFEIVGDLLAERRPDHRGGTSARPCSCRSRWARQPRRLAASGAVSSAADLARFATELLAPTLIAATTLEEATTVQLPGLDGVLPGFGRQSPNDWGLGFELRDAKRPHWTAPTGSPRTFGHFGRSGTFLWIDPDARVGCVYLGDADFGPWAADVIFPQTYSDTRHQGNQRVMNIVVQAEV
jgi:CubicO group peptidase (beta-lactamase class C family)